MVPISQSIFRSPTLKLAIEQDDHTIIQCIDEISRECLDTATAFVSDINLVYGNLYMILKGVPDLFYCYPMNFSAWFSIMPSHINVS